MKFIKPNIPFDRKEEGYAPLFRRVFTIDTPIEAATVCFAGLGYGYLYLNGKEVSPDRFISPVSDYNKTVWYTKYDVTHLLQPGENIAAVCCGNGWFNEPFPTAWDYDTACWRDLPKMMLQLEINGKIALESDESWKCVPFSATTYNQLRLGEVFDARLYDENWNTLQFDDSAWPSAALATAPSGALRECRCEPIRECGEYPVKSYEKLGENHYILDFGQNLSGYLRLKVCQPAGEEIILRHAERLEDGGLYHDPDWDHFYPERGDKFQVDRLICNGKPIEWSPRFTYHGFRYVEAIGLRDPQSAVAIFVHQDVKERTAFRCSDERLNRLFRCGQMATYSNLFYMPTDCPTREKLGWCNDAQSSMEQFFTDFEIGRVMEKWLQDIKDAMREDGALPGIIPSSGWGYHWGNGPVSEGILFEVPYCLWKYTGNAQALIDCIPYFERHFSFLKTKQAENGTLTYGLNDWAALYGEGRVDEVFLNELLRLKFYRIMITALQLKGDSAEQYEALAQKQEKKITTRYLSKNGRCILHKQTAVAMLLCMGFGDDTLKAQFKQLIEEEEFHHDCGMVGMRYLFHALNLCGLQEYAYRILTVEGNPSYADGKPAFTDWLRDDATTLYEYWNLRGSRNHHMYSCFMTWLIQTVLGITADHEKAEINPCFLKEIDFAEGKVNGVKLHWQKNSGTASLSIAVPENFPVIYAEQTLSPGEHQFKVVL